jgi:hypothetical protein
MKYGTEDWTYSIDFLTDRIAGSSVWKMALGYCFGRVNAV